MGIRKIKFKILKAEVAGIQVWEYINDIKGIKLFEVDANQCIEFSGKEYRDFIRSEAERLGLINVIAKKGDIVSSSL